MGKIFAAFVYTLTIQFGGATGRNHPTRVLIGYQQNCSADAVINSLKLQYGGDSAVAVLETLAANVTGRMLETDAERTRRAVLQSLSFKLNVEVNNLTTTEAAFAVQQESWESLVKQRFAETNIDVIEDTRRAASSAVVSRLGESLPCLSFQPHPDIIFTTKEFFGPDITAGRNESLHTASEPSTKPNMPNDPAVHEGDLQYYLRTTRIIDGENSVWMKTVGDVTVGVLDSGCTFHPDLAPQYWIDETVKECVGATPTNPKFGSRCYGLDAGEGISALRSHDSHGTAVAGFIAAATNNGFSIAGPCMGCKIACVKIANADNDILLSDAIAGINWLIEKKIKISNHSYNAYAAVTAKAYRAAFDALMAPNDHLFVTAAGNEKCDIDALPGSKAWTCRNTRGTLLKEAPLPATYNHQNMLVVGSIGKSTQRSWFSNWGAVSVDIFAPGEQVGGIMNTDHETMPEAWRYLKYHDGTSFSSPLTAGIAALVWSANPHFTANQVKNHVMLTAKKLPGFDALCVSGGMVDATAALASVTRTFPLPPPTANPTKDLTAFFYGKLPGTAACHVPSFTIAVVMLLALTVGVM